MAFTQILLKTFYTEKNEMDIELSEYTHLFHGYQDSLEIRYFLYP